MSSLGNLFSSNQSPDSTNTLKYNAPKEPKQNKQSSSSITTNKVINSTTQPLITSTSSSTKLQQAAVASKIMVSAAVRLFKFNTITNVYDAIENNSVLGCVLMGSGVTFQILVYNAQKAPQAIVPITTTFDYTLRDLYMSFVDSSGNQWSLLFDTAEVMIPFIRNVVMTILHLLTHNQSSSEIISIKRSLHSKAITSIMESNEDDTKLSIGMTAGIQLCAFEVGGDLNCFPGDALTTVPYFNTSTNDLIKYKLVNSGELIGGLTSVLIGLRRGECCLVGISPKLFYESSNDGPLDLSSRRYPGSWVLFEVEVCKIKSSEKKKEKAITNNIPAPLVIGGIVPRTPSSNPSSITERMAYLSSSQSQFGSQQQKLAEVMNDSHNSSSSNNSSNRKQNFDKERENNSNKIVTENRYNNNNVMNSSNNNNSNYDNRNNNERSNNGDNLERYSDYNENNNSFSNNNNYENRLTVINGQESRSYYDTHVGDSGDCYDTHSAAANPNPNQRHSYKNTSYTTSNNILNHENNNNIYNTNNNTINNSLQFMQQSMVQLHSKVDQVGAQVANSYAFQQQVLTLNSSTANLPFSNFNLLQQQQQLLQQMSGIANPNFNSLVVSSSLPYNNNANMVALAPQQQQQFTQNNNNNTMRLKTEDLISTLNVILQEYEAGKAEVAKYNTSIISGNTNRNNNIASASSNMQEQESIISTLKSNLEKIEEKTQLLQNKNEKLMSEKSDLLEKQADLIQASCSSSSKFYQLQMEFDSFRRENTDLKLQSNNKIDDSNRELQDEIQKLRSKFSVHNEEIKVFKDMLEQKTQEQLLLLNQNELINRENRLLKSDIENNKQHLMELETTINQLSTLSLSIKENEEGNDQTSIPLLESKIKENLILIEQRDQLITQLKDELVRLTNNNDIANVNTASYSSSYIVVVKSIMQDVYDKACEYFNSDQQEEEIQYATSEILKKLRLILKFVSNKNTTQMVDENNI